MSPIVARVEEAVVATHPVGVDRERDQQPGEADAGRDQLPRDVVALVPRDVVARDAGDAPDAVGDEGDDRAEQDQIEPPHDRQQVGAGQRPRGRRGVVDHQSEGTSSTTVALTP